MSIEFFRFCLTISCLVSLSSANCNYCYGGDNGAKTTYQTPPCNAPDFPRNKDVGSCSRASPIPINSNEARVINTPTLILGDADVEYANLTNFGIYLQARYLNQNGQMYYTEGGIAYNQRYIFYCDLFFWASSTCGITGTTVNGQGAPAGVHSIYYNVNYKSFEESLKHPDGLIGFVKLFQLRPDPNPAFNNFARDILQVTKYGSSTIVRAKDAFSWYFVFNETTNYFAYPGQYIDEFGAAYNCITYIVFPFSTVSPYIGLGQFRDSFLKIQNEFGNPQSSALPVNRRCNTPVICTQGLKNFIST